ncbi:MAG: phenylalanine--tRNA ligase subunit alpha, partial [Oscillospiraceae bacterium]
MREQLEKIKVDTISAIENTHLLSELDDIRVKILGKKGEVTAILKQMGKLSAEDRPIMGALANDVREAVENALEEKITRLNSELL